jgi:hypothetical protein
MLCTPQEASEATRARVVTFKEAFKIDVLIAKKVPLFYGP